MFSHNGPVSKIKDNMYVLSVSPGGSTGAKLLSTVAGLFNFVFLTFEVLIVPVRA